MTILTLNPVQKNLVPKNPREAVRKTFGIQEPMTLKDLMKTDLWKELEKEYQAERKDVELKPLDFDCVESGAEKFDLRDFMIDYVEQRERLKDPIYRKAIIEMALNFSVKDADIPSPKKPKDGKYQIPHLTDWQKRSFALLLRETFEYEARVVLTTELELSSDFNSQFKRKDNIKQHDRYKGDLADGKEKAWAMQKCFDRLMLTVYPYGDPPVLTGLTDVTTAMFNPKLNPDHKDKELKDLEFKNFSRAIEIYREVWPHLAEERIYGSWIRGCTAVIASFDKEVLKGTGDKWLVTILKEAKKEDYELHKEDGEFIGFEEPFDWTANNNWQGNRFHQNAIISVAKAWNKILSKNRKLKKIIPQLDDDLISGLSSETVRFIHMGLKS